MTLNLLNWVPEGIILCSDSMLTLTSFTPQGVITTNYEHAEKLIELGTMEPAGAMINGIGSIVDELVSQILKRASAEIDFGAVPANHDGVMDAVRRNVDSVYRSKIPVMKAMAAEAWSSPVGIAQVNGQRVSRGLDPVERVDPDRVALQNDPENSSDESAYDVVIQQDLTIVVASHFGNAPRATSLSWPGPREVAIVPEQGQRITWWGSGGIPVGRLVLGIDHTVLEPLANKEQSARDFLSYVTQNPLDFVMPAPTAAMPLQDAIAFTEYLGEVARGYDQFKAGPPGVGGELDVLVLTPNAKEWVYHKHIHSSLSRGQRG